MDDHSNSRPPAPSGTEPQPTGRRPAGDASQATHDLGAQLVPAQTADGGRGGHTRGGGLRLLLFALLGGVVGALALFGVLKLTGALNKTTTVTSSTAGQTITIDASTEDATVAQAVSAKALPSVVSIYVANSSEAGIGSGVILDSSGDILTNYHVVEDMSTIQVTTSDNATYDATVVGSDESSDLAVIKIDPGTDTLTPIEVGDSSSLVTGDWVMTIGSPYGLDQSVSAGIVSALYRSTMLASTSGTTIYANLIQTDAAINSGNSGGALVNDEGQLVGINSLVESESGSNAGIGFAIDGNYAVKIADTIISGKTVEHAYLGVSLQTVNSYNARTNSLSVDQGAYVASVTSGSAAANAGLQEGDIITAIDGTQVSSSSAVILAVRQHDVGDTMQVTFMRGSEEKTVTVTLGSDNGQNLYSSDSSSSSSTYGGSGSSSGSSSSNGYSGSYGSSGSGSTSSWSASIYVDENQVADDGSETFAA